MPKVLAEPEQTCLPRALRGQVCVLVAGVLRHMKERAGRK